MISDASVSSGCPSPEFFCQAFDSQPRSELMSAIWKEEFGVKEKDEAWPDQSPLAQPSLLYNDSNSDSDSGLNPETPRTS